MRDLANKIVAFETEMSLGARSKSPLAFEACEKLLTHLESIMGRAGCNTLVTRALALAEEESPVMSTLRVRADGSLGGDEELGPLAEVQQVAEGSLVLLAQLLGLLVTFIGRDLAQQMLLDVWPELPADDCSVNDDRR